MFFLIFGTRASKRTVGSGMFFCPNEQSDQSYRQVAVKRMGHLFFRLCLACPLDLFGS